MKIYHTEQGSTVISLLPEDIAPSVADILYKHDVSRFHATYDRARLSIVARAEQRLRNAKVEADAALAYLESAYAIPLSEPTGE